jgi:hypothetical protein
MVSDHHIRIHASDVAGTPYSTQHSKNTVHHHYEEVQRAHKMGESSGLICIILILLLFGIGGPSTYVVVVRDQEAPATTSEVTRTAEATDTSPSVSVTDSVNSTAARAYVASTPSSTSSGFQAHTKIARDGDLFHENYFYFNSSTLKNGKTFISAVRSTMQSHPGSQHDLLASLLHASCLANTPQARRLDYHTDTCPYMAESFLSSTDIDWRQIVRKNFYSVVLTSSKEYGSVGRWFCDAVFPPRWQVGVRQTKLTRMVEADCEAGRMREMEERRTRDDIKTVG